MDKAKSSRSSSRFKCRHSSATKTPSQYTQQHHDAEEANWRYAGVFRRAGLSRPRHGETPAQHRQTAIKDRGSSTSAVATAPRRKKVRNQIPAAWLYRPGSTFLLVRRPLRHKLIADAIVLACHGAQKLGTTRHRLADATRSSRRRLPVPVESASASPRCWRLAVAEIS